MHLLSYWSWKLQDRSVTRQVSSHRYYESCVLSLELTQLGLMHYSFACRESLLCNPIACFNGALYAELLWPNSHNPSGDFPDPPGTVHLGFSKSFLSRCPLLYYPPDLSFFPYECSDVEFPTSLPVLRSMVTTVHRFQVVIWSAYRVQYINPRLSEPVYCYDSHILFYLLRRLLVNTVSHLDRFAFCRWIGSAVSPANDPAFRLPLLLHRLNLPCDLFSQGC